MSSVQKIGREALMSKYLIYETLLVILVGLLSANTVGEELGTWIFKQDAGQHLTGAM